jgi:hypothetical protein
MRASLGRNPSAPERWSMAKPAPGEHREEQRGVVEEENLLIA